MMARTFQLADLFCGAGGTSTGALQAIRAAGLNPQLTAVNHWPRAVETHTANHPDARHVCAAVDSINPRHLYPDGSLDALWASPECTHFSLARGGKPMSDQSRATAWCVTRWAEALRPGVIWIENVPEFATWGPIGSNGRPLESRKGEVFRAWLASLEAIGYRVDYRELVAADYGDPTTRRRLFIQAVRGRRRIAWPEATHEPGADPGLFGKPRWRGASECIDWSLPSASVFERKRPLSPKTWARIAEGLRRFGIPTPDSPSTPFLIHTAHAGERASMDISNPLPTVARNRGDIALVEANLNQPRAGESFIISMEHGGKVLDPKLPLNTITTARGGAHGLVQAFLLPQQSAGALRSVTEPCPTVSTAGAIALIEPFLVEYYGTGGSSSIQDPLPTVTTKERFGLVHPVVEHQGQAYLLDIRFRMLQPSELAAAQGFPTDYRFTGSKTEVVKQIGNAVPCGLARALVQAHFQANPTTSTR